jgi:hypothetical protein
MLTPHPARFVGPRSTRFLVAGWFSFENGHATAGDALARDLVCEWLAIEGLGFDVAVAPPFTGGVDVCSVDPLAYSHLVMVCGPFEQGELERILLKRFWRSRLIGLNLSMQAPVDEWQPFDLLLERDSSRAANPDLVFGTKQPLVPVIGVCLVEDYPRGRTDLANQAITQLLARHTVAAIDIDTRLDTNKAGFRNAAEIESVLARVSVVVTTRLHGLVLGLKNSVPVLAIDPEPGGAKIRRQAATIGWPIVFDVSALSQTDLDNALRYCVGDEARQLAIQCARRAATTVSNLRLTLSQALNDGNGLESRYRERLLAAPQFPDWMSEAAGRSMNQHTRFMLALREKLLSPLRKRTKRWLSSNERSRVL